MSTLAIVGTVLVLLGVATLAYQEVAFSVPEAGLRFGPFGSVTAREPAILLSPLVGAVAVGGGLVLLLA